jgi:hypothetical protein
MINQHERQREKKSNLRLCAARKKEIRYDVAGLTLLFAISGREPGSLLNSEGSWHDFNMVLILGASCKLVWQYSSF